MFTVLIPKIVTKPTKLVDKKTGAFLLEQLVQIDHPEQFCPVAASILLEATDNPKEIGRYHMAAESLSAGEYGRPAFRLKLGKKIEAQKAAA